MRAISKRGAGGFQLNQAHVNPPQTGAQATSRWHGFKHKTTVLEQLFDEQYRLCCYSEIRPDLLGVGSHIEHVQPKSRYPQRTFDYQNLAASALDSESDLKAFKGQAQEVFAGHAKLGKYDPDLFVSCHQSDCARFFAYLSDGRVVPASGLAPDDMAKASYTITLLNLNSPYLLTQRQSWWDELENLFDEHHAKGWSLEHLAEVDLIPTNGKLSQFFSLTRQFFGPVADRIFAQHGLPL
jgi:uncharacterized protein (TIGR02646 family)